jgi:hypothetical protein
MYCGFNLLVYSPLFSIWWYFDVVKSIDLQKGYIILFGKIILGYSTSGDIW